MQWKLRLSLFLQYKYGKNADSQNIRKNKRIFTEQSDKKIYTLEKENK